MSYGHLVMGRLPREENIPRERIDDPKHVGPHTCLTSFDHGGYKQLRPSKHAIEPRRIGTYWLHFDVFSGHIRTQAWEILRLGIFSLMMISVFFWRSHWDLWWFYHPLRGVTWRMIRTNQLATMWAPGKMMKQFGKTLEEARKTYSVTSSKHGKHTKKIKKVWIITMLSMVKSTTHGNVQ